MLSEEEQSVLEYARFHGLTIDHTKLDPFEGFERPSEPYPEDSHLSQINFADFVPKPERLTVTKDDLRYLSAALDTPAKPDVSELLKTRWHLAQDLRMELPLYHKDPEVDRTRHFSNLTRWKEEFHDLIATTSAPSKSKKAMASPKLGTLCARVEHTMASEKLVLSKEDMLFLQESLKPPPREAVKACREEIFAALKKPLQSPMYSPLMPRYPEVELPPFPDIPSLSPMGEEAENPVEKCRRIEDKLLKRDTILDTPTRNIVDKTYNDNSLGLIYSPFKVVMKPPLADVAKIRKTRDLRMEEPITPPDREQQQKKPTLTVPRILEEMGVHLPSPIASPDGTSTKDLDNLMRDIEPIARRVNHAIEQEQLGETRIACKMKLLPIEDVKTPNPPWKVYEMADPGDRERIKSGFLGKVKSDLSTYPDERLKELETSLQWLSADDLEPKEEITSDIPLDEWFATPPHPNLSAFAWRPEPADLNDLDSDLEEIETADLPDPSEMSVLLKRRKIDICKAPSSIFGTVGVRTDCHDIDNSSPKRQRRTPFSPMGAVDDFLAARSGLALERKPSRNAPESMLAKTSQHSEAARDETNDLHSSVASPDIDVPLPPILAPLSRAQCIVSSTFMTLRGLVRHLQRLYPALDLIERDYGKATTRSVQNTTPGRFPATSWSAESFGNEVDIIVSPTTGILLTTVQKLHQRPLPGSKAPQALQARLVSVAPEYESVVLFVSQSLNKDIAPTALTASDSTAVAEITAFSKSAYFKSLNVDVSVVLSVGGEKHLAHWLAAYVAQHSPSIPDIILKLEETRWEVWLRRIGLNAFAAQALLSALGNSGTSKDSNGTSFGLAELVRMQASERTRMFSGLLGSAAMDRVNRVLDTKWG